MQSKAKKICGYNVWVACKLLLAVFAVVLGVQMCAMSVQAEGEGYSGTPVKPSKITAENYEDYGFTADNYEEYLGYYGIRNAEELYGFAEMMNSLGSSGYYGKLHSAVVVEDIVVNSGVFDEEGYLVAEELYAWTPIQNFNGIFDGAGHTISGLYYEDSGKSEVGLFGKLRSDVDTTEIKNINIRDSYIEGNKAVGGIVGYAWEENKIINCSFSGKIVGKGEVGGIVGHGNGATPIQGCSNAGCVEGTTQVGGIIGLGGSIEKCYNTGNVIGVQEVGGIHGFYGTVEDCYNIGRVEGECCVAGISNSTISNCYNTGYCKGDSQVYAIGETNTNSYYLDTCGVEDENAEAKTAEQFANGEVCFLLNGSTSKGRLSWYQTLGVDEMPVFEGDIIYASYAHGATEGTYSNTKKEGVHTTPDEDGSHDTYYEVVTNEYGVTLYICSVCGCAKNPFADVFEKDWYYPFALRAYAEGLMSGVGTDEATGLVKFAPNTKVTREQFVQILYNREGKPEVEYSDVFSDVAEQSSSVWYSNAIMWASQNNLVSGYDNGKFGVGDVITREQVAVILKKYAQFKGYDTTYTMTPNDLQKRFNDVDKIHDWAMDSLCWAVEYKVMNGKGSGLDPLGNASRAEAATMILNMMDSYEE